MTAMTAMTAIIQTECLVGQSQGPDCKSRTKIPRFLQHFNPDVSRKSMEGPWLCSCGDSVCW